MSILNLYPTANTQGLNYNLELQQPAVKSNTFLHVIRVDYQMSSKLRLTAKYAGSNGTVKTTPGTMPGFNDVLFKFPAILVP